MSISKYTFLVGALASILTAYPAAADDVAASVAARLRDSGRLEDYRVNVKANEGTVFLEGEVSDARQIAAAVSLAENTEGVERVVNRLSLKTAKQRSGIGLALPQSMRTFIGMQPEDAGSKATPQFVAAGSGDMQVSATPATGRADQTPPAGSPAAKPTFVSPAEVVPAEAAATSEAPAEAQPSGEKQPVTTAALEGSDPTPAAQPVSATAQATQAPRGPAAAPTAARSNTPRPLAKTNAAAMSAPPSAPGQVRQASPKKSQTLVSWVKQVAGVMGGESVVPGSERVIGDYGPGEYVPGSAGVPGGYSGGGYVEGGMADGGYVDGGYSDGGYVDGGTVSGGYAGGYSGQPVMGGPGYGGGNLGRPMPMGSAGVGMPPVPMRGDGPNMPNYAWPSYASYPNYAALQYPGQYSPTAWPYIGPFYPYPQVPLGWRRVSLEWDDGWWFLDFDDRPQHH
jgi:hypothetical protein